MLSVIVTCYKYVFCLRQGGTPFEIALLKEGTTQEEFFCLVYESWLDPDSQTCSIPKNDINNAARLKKSPSPSWMRYSFRTCETFGEFLKYLGK